MRRSSVPGLVLALLALVAGVAEAAPTADPQPPILPPEPASASADLHDPFTARATDLRDPFAADPQSRRHESKSSPDPDLRDPFRGRTDLQNPFVARTPSDLRDPFPAGRARRPADLPDQHDPFAARAERDAPPSDLRDPFAAQARRRSGGSIAAPRSRASADGVDELGLKDPFHAPATQRPRKRHAADVEPTPSDLKNPFARRKPPVRAAGPASTPLRPLRAPPIRRTTPVPLQRPSHPAPAPAR